MISLQNMESTAVSGKRSADDDSSHDIRSSNKKFKRVVDHDFSSKMQINFVNSALTQLDRNDPSSIENLVEKLNLPESHPESYSIPHLTMVLNYLSNEMSRLDNRHCTELINAVLRLDWSQHLTEGRYVQAYSNFCKVLVSSIPKWSGSVFQKIVSEFTRFSQLSIHHGLIKFLLKIVPTGTSILLEKLQRSFPNRYMDKSQLVNYVENLLCVIDYSPELNYQIWCLIVENCIKMDVELQNELDDLDEDEEIETNDQVSNFTAKLDSLMLILLERFETEQDEKLRNFQNLMTVFKSHILSTHYTKCIQYLLFHLSQQNNEMIDSFLAMLLDTTFNPREVISNRIKSIQYVSSYVARSAKVTTAQIMFVLDYLMEWLEQFVAERESEIEANTISLTNFKLFYCVFQTVLYIFCFRCEALMETNVNWTRFFQRMVVSKFNPLRYCNETVVLIFARIAQKHDVCYCFSVIEQNKRSRLSGENSLVGLDSEFTDLESFFPFDPLILKSCQKKIKSLYIDWTDDSEGDDDSDDSNDDDDSEDDTASENESDDDDASSDSE
ncbi:unnamed protein product [Kuraishia capsulata CBS 1993]|uniref:RNA polymerase I-specific transcription initiation factor RRN3 n=1 Tax=Kuraishia capsulata CBS 1993 TaxID=1382522 RepID=W6MQG2_9ASCO|nr:uncharacterized protein KUCA_T00000090001 [Kuraishia capsulata CBS 1993]CDK24130.1 unnamed protein product [Kuraishia capsulata CBS 1993]